jgi:hypothetical protein
MIFDWLQIALALGVGFYLASRSPLLATSIKLGVLGVWGAFTFVAPIVVIVAVYLPARQYAAILAVLALSAFLAVLWIATCPAEIRKILANRNNRILWDK